MENKKQYLFICAGGEALPRWQEAFSQAMYADPADAGSRRFDEQPALIWLRLHAAEPAASQIAAVRNRFASVPIVAMSDEPSDAEAASVFAAGARGYCNAHASSGLLQQVASVVTQGGLWIGEDLMQRMLALANFLPQSPASSRQWQEALSEREREVAHELSAGASNKEIARRLGIAERTVKMHVSSIFAKLNVRDRLQLSILLRS